MHEWVQDDRDQQPYRLRFVSDGTLSDEFFFVAQVRPLERTPRVVNTHPRMRMHICTCPRACIAPPRCPLPGAAA
jgi:hypothetical protein